MAAHGWGTERPIVDRLFAEGEHFDFYQAVRLLELLYPQNARVGDAFDPAREVVRFVSWGGLDFPQSEIRWIAPPTAGVPATMGINFLGLAGAMGPLPAPYTELMLGRIAEKDTAMRDFLDMFNHRLVSLAYRARRLYRVALETRTADHSHFARSFRSFVGLETSGLRRRMEVEDRSLLYFAGLFTEHPRSMAGLEAIIGEYFDLPVRGVQLSGRWLAIEAEQWTTIGRGGRNNTLGGEAVLGRRFWDQMRAFELHIGPIAHKRLMSFLPGGDAFAQIRALIDFYAGTDMECTLVLEVDTATVSPLALGTRSNARLGWTTWLPETGERSRRYRVRV